MRLVTVFGVEIRLNLFFMLLFPVYWYFGLLVQALIVFGVVFLHEMGHVVVALGYGIKVKEVELLPFGGVARLEGGIETDPVVEIYVALAGPLTNGFLALIGYVLDSRGMGNQQWLPFFVQCNLVLGLFNLMPAIPMDGGRIMRALFSLRLGLPGATHKAAALSAWLSAGMAAVGVWSLMYNEGRHVNFLVIGLFLYYSAAKEKGSAMYVFMRFLARKKEELFREGLLLARHVVALENSSLQDVVKFFIPRKYHLVVVIDKNQGVRGTLTEGQVIGALLAGGRQTTVGALVGPEK